VKWCQRHLNVVQFSSLFLRVYKINCSSQYSRECLQKQPEPCLANNSDSLNPSSSPLRFSANDRTCKEIILKDYLLDEKEEIFL
jgi:hypothetical protein